MEINMKSGFAAIMGRANVGKSTLMNALVGEKIAIVSDKPQTTRGRVIGIYNSDEMQIVFIDTPGIHQPKNALGKYMVKAANDAATGVDVILLVAECRGAGKTEVQLCERLKNSGTPVILVLNKVDITPKKDVAEAIIQYSNLFDFASIIPISAKTGDGVEIVMKELSTFIGDGELYYPTDIATDMDMRTLTQEIIREKFLNCLHDEIPHGIAVETVLFKDAETTKGEPIANITVNIICEREQHKGIIIGKGGQTLKNAVSLARKELEEMFGTKVFLQCFVKVREGWRDNENLIKSYGLASSDGSDT